MKKFYKNTLGGELAVNKDMIMMSVASHLYALFYVSPLLHADEEGLKGCLFFSVPMATAER